MDKAQAALLKNDLDAWNAWRSKHQSAQIDLTNAQLGKLQIPKVNLEGAQLDGVKLRWAYMREAKLSRATLVGADLRIIDLSRADLRGADLRKARLDGAYLREAQLDKADLRGASLVGVNFDRASFRNANLENANLRNAVLVDTDFTEANLNESRVYGASVWNITTRGAQQHNLKITRENEAQITVDNLNVAQFIYLMLSNKEIRDVIDTMTSKAVLILGRFTPERKTALEVVRTELRNRNYLPIMFDFEASSNRDTDEAINLLGRMAKFIIADLSDAKSVPQELKGIVEGSPSIPVQPILSGREAPYGMFDHIARYPWVLKPFRYENLNELVSKMHEKVILPAESRIKEQRMGRIGEA